MKAANKTNLENLENNKYNYRGKSFTVKSFKEVNSTIVIKTDVRTLTFLESEIPQFLNELTDYIEPKPMIFSKENTLPEIPFNYQKTATHQKLEESLKTMIDKVMNDKDAIPQATAICNISNSLVNLEKQQLNFLRMTKQI